MQKILFKAEVFLDSSYYLHEYIWRHGVQTSFVLVYDYLKYHLVEQLREREQALLSLADTRFSRLASHLLAEISCLREKHKVPESPVSELKRLREFILLKKGR